MAKILLVEDDLEVCEVVSDWLVDEHYTIDVVNSETKRLSAFASTSTTS